MPVFHGYVEVTCIIKVWHSIATTATDNLRNTQPQIVNSAQLRATLAP